jgi:hypothetical protein
LTIASSNALDAGNILKKAVKSFNAGHLAHASKRRVRENKLVEHVKRELENDAKIGKTKKHYKNKYHSYGKITFLHQPEIDLLFLYDGFLHGVEFKLAHTGDNLVFYKGADEALAHSTYGIDFSWIVHFYEMHYDNLDSYQKWMEYTIQHSKCPSIGYIAATTNSCQIYVCPTKPFSRLLQVDKDIRKAVSTERKYLIKQLGETL